MHLLSILLLGISTNLDNMFIGVSYGLRNKRITWSSNLVIGLFSAAATYLFCYLSSLLTEFGRTPNVVGGVFIIFVGILALIRKGDNEEKSICLGWKKTILLSGCLAVNCLPAAFGAGLTGINPLYAAVSVGGLSVLAIATGNRLALRAVSTKLNQRMLEILGGLIMVALGAIEIFI